MNIRKRLKAVSPIMSTIMLILIAVSIAAFVGPWMYKFVTNTTDDITGSGQQDIICRNAAYDFDSDYQTYGVKWNLTGNTDTLSAKIINTGTIKLYNFTFEIVTNTSSGLTVQKLNVNTTTQRTSSNPLRPSESVILKAVITANITGTLKEVKIRNDACKKIYIKQEF